MLQNAELLKEFVEEALTHAESVEVGLLKLERDGHDSETVRSLFRAVHSIKGTAGFFSLKNIVELSHIMESLFSEINNQVTLTGSMIDSLLAANDSLRTMIMDVETSDSFDISVHLTRITKMLSQPSALTPPVNDWVSTPDQSDITAEADGLNPQETTGPAKALTFYLCGNHFGVDITTVKEINRNIEYTPVPDAPEHIIGLLNLRGQVVTLFDLAKVMGYDERYCSYERRGCIILKCKTGNNDFLGFLIDRPDSVLDLDCGICEPPPANMGSIEQKYISQVVKLDSGLLRIIDREVLYLL